MTPTPSEIQTALDFLAWLRSSDKAAMGAHRIPASVDYEALAALARQSGFDAPAPAIAEAFRTLMRARAFAVSRGA